MSDQEVIDCVMVNLNENYKRLTFPKKFNCGDAIIDDYFNSGSLKRALASENVHALAYVNQRGQIFGFATLTFVMLDKARVQNFLKQGNVPGQVPAAKIQILAVDKSQQKQGFGVDLVMESLERVVQVHKLIPIKGVYLDAAPGKESFYQRIGFVLLGDPSENGTTPMFYPIRELVAAVDVARQAPSG